MNMKKWSSQWTQFMQLRKKPEKNSGLQRGLNPRPRDTRAMLNQLSYEATDVGRRSIVGSYVPVKKMSVNDIWNKSYMNCGNEMKMKKWSSQWMPFMQLRKEAWKNFRTSTESIAPVIVRSRVQTPLKSWIFFQASLRNCINCFHRDDHFFIFKKDFVISIIVSQKPHVEWMNVISTW